MQELDCLQVLFEGCEVLEERELENDEDISRLNLKSLFPIRNIFLIGNDPDCRPGANGLASPRPTPPTYQK